MFKIRYPHVHNMADVGYIIGGPIGREVLGAAQIIFIVFVCGSHVLTGLIAFDTSMSKYVVCCPPTDVVSSYRRRVMFCPLGWRLRYYMHGPDDTAHVGRHRLP